jgi:hypothetical protein
MQIQLMGLVLLVVMLSPALCFSLSSLSEKGNDNAPDEVEVSKRYMRSACSRCMHTGDWSSCSSCRLGPVPYYGIGKRTFFPRDSWKREAKRAFLPEDSLDETSNYFPESNWDGLYKRADDIDTDKRSFFSTDKWDYKRTFFPIERFNKAWDVKRSFFPVPSDNWDFKRTFFPEHSWRYKRQDSNSLELKVCKECCSAASFSPRCCYFCQMK